MFENDLESVSLRQGQLRRCSRMMRTFLGITVAAIVFGFGATQSPRDQDATSTTAMPIPPPCLLNNNCGVGDRDNLGYYTELRAACEELWSRGLNSADCAYLNQ